MNTAMLNIIKKAVKKSILFKIGTVAAALFALLIFAKLSLSWIAPERLLKDSLTAFFKDNFGKAIKFEDVDLTLAGNIKIVNLNVSISNDFNDNISLIQSPSVTVNLAIPSLLRKKMIVTGIRFDHPQVILLKRYDRGYGETLSDLFLSGKPLDEFGDIDMDNFRVILSGGTVALVEYLVDGKITVDCRKVFMELGIRKDSIIYRVTGILVPFGSREISRGDFSAEGSFYRIRGGKGYSSAHRVSVENFDLSHLNAKLMSQPYALFGGMSVGAKVHTMNGHVSIDGTADLNNLNLVERMPEGARSIIANENLTIALTADLLNEGKLLIARKIDISDDSMKLDGGGVYGKNDREEYFDVALGRCEIDLARVSEWLTPWQNLRCKGSIKANGRFAYNIRNNRSAGMLLDLQLEDYSMERKGTGSKTVLLSVPTARLAITDGAFTVSAAARKDKSDLALKGEGYAPGRLPLASESRFVFNSEKMEALYPIQTAYRALRGLYADAFEDKTRGYEQIYFMQTPLGVFVNNNTIECDFKADKLLFGGREALRGLKAGFRLSDGTLRLENFSLVGFGGEYGLDAYAYLKSDYPGGAVSGRIAAIDLEQAAKSLGMKGAMSGTLGADFKFEFSGNRTAHLLDNGKIEFNLTMDSGRMRGTAFQKRLKEFLLANGFSEPSIGDIGFTKVTLSANQSGENIYFSNMVFSGDSLSASGYGTCMPGAGMRIPVNLTYMEIGTEDAPGITTNVPLVIAGRLFAPVLRVMNKKDSAESALFNID